MPPLHEMIEKNEKGHIRGLNFRFGSNHVSINSYFRAGGNQGPTGLNLASLATLGMENKRSTQKALRTFFQ